MNFILVRLSTSGRRIFSFSISAASWSCSIICLLSGICIICPASRRVVITGPVGCKPGAACGYWQFPAQLFLRTSRVCLRACGYSERESKRTTARPLDLCPFEPIVSGARKNCTEPMTLCNFTIQLDEKERRGERRLCCRSRMRRHATTRVRNFKIVKKRKKYHY